MMRPLIMMTFWSWPSHLPIPPRPQNNRCWAIHLRSWANDTLGSVWTSTGRSILALGNEKRQAGGCQRWSNYKGNHQKNIKMTGLNILFDLFATCRFNEVHTMSTNIFVDDTPRFQHRCFPLFLFRGACWPDPGPAGRVGRHSFWSSRCRFAPWWRHISAGKDPETKKFRGVSMLRNFTPQLVLLEVLLLLTLK